MHSSSCAPSPSRCALASSPPCRSCGSCRPRRPRRPWSRTVRASLLPLVGLLLVAGPSRSETLAPAEAARKVLEVAGVRGGLVVHLGCRDGALTAALRATDAFVVHGLSRSAAEVEATRRHLVGRGLYGPVSVDRLAGSRLPYVDNLVNLVVVSDPEAVGADEVLRVLRPGGVACTRRGEGWIRTEKPVPDEIDDWTHYLHDASGNAVSGDTVVAPPDRLQWVGSPRFSRHHDRMSSLSALVSAAGRLFYIFDEGSPVSILLPPEWKLIARDAHNGTILWKRPLTSWHTHLWPLKSGPAQLPRRLVATGDRVYATLSLDGPVTALEAATGETVRTYESTRGAEEIIVDDGILFALVNPAAKPPAYAGLKRIQKAYGDPFWDEETRRIVALRPSDGKELWSVEGRVLPVTLAADVRGVYYHDGESIVSLDRLTGERRWRSEPVARSSIIPSFYAPTLLVWEDVVLFSGGETAGVQTGSWYTKGKDTMSALSARTGELLWRAYHPPSGYRSPEDLLVAGGLVWTGETTSGRAEGVFTGRDPRTGEVRSEFPPDVDTYWFHHRCYRGKATERFLLMARTGTEFIDIRSEHWKPHHWFRGSCLYGIMPANGLIYAPQNPCACYLEAKLFGLNALAPARSGPRVRPEEIAAPRLEQGPAFGAVEEVAASAEDWPTYRGNAARSGRTEATTPVPSAPAWRVDLDGRVTSPVVADGRVLLAAIDRHTVHALDAANGRSLWSRTVGGRVDSPPTCWRGRVLFGSADGHVYCLRATDGELVWRFRAAPTDERMVFFEQVESVWPVPGSVLVENDTLYFVAGRSMFVDGGLRFWRLDPRTGRALSETVLDDRDPRRGAGGDGGPGDGGGQEGAGLQRYVSWLNMPPALPDILSSDGKLVYMRSQPFRPDGTRLPLEKMPTTGNADAGAPPADQRAEHAHIFCPTGFRDDSWWHRTYWMFGSTYVSGWCGYFLAGKSAPAGRILVFDDDAVYGFGRKPRYYRWTTPIEHQLFAAERRGGDGEEVGKLESRVRFSKSSRLDPQGRPLTVEAWVRADKADGVVVARGGGSHGYALYIRGGRPAFALRSREVPAKVVADRSVLGRWAHIAGVLTEEKELQIWVDGEIAGRGAAPELLTVDPAEGMQIGADEGSIVGDHDSALAFRGRIDELRIWHRALGGQDIARSATGARPRPGASKGALVLWLPFDDDKAVDASGGTTTGEVDGAVPAAGKIGGSFAFTGVERSAEGYKVRHRWTTDLPIHVRAMTLTGSTLFVAGPPDLVDEQEMMRTIDDPATQSRLAEQAEAFAGKRGALLLGISRGEGREVGRLELDALPVFDGLIAAGGALYLSTTGGEVICLRPSDRR